MKVDIIGAGVAGLSLGIYLQRQGIETQIYEHHIKPGGLCTGWTRGKYSFNGCMHWLLGAGDGIAFHHYLSELIDLSKLHFIYHDERVQIERGTETFHLYNDLKRFEQYLLSIAPEDKEVIRQWIDCVELISKYQPYLPPLFLSDEGLLQKLRKVHQMRGMWRLLLMLRKWKGVRLSQFAERFTNPRLRCFVSHLYREDMLCTHLFFAQSYADRSLSAYPEGGSEAFADALYDSYIEHGGVVRFGCKVEHVIVEDNAACGLEYVESGDRKTDTADVVCSAADWTWTMISALGGRYLTGRQMELAQNAAAHTYPSFIILYLGVSDAMADVPHFVRFEVGELSLPDGTTVDDLEVHTYNYDHRLSPEGTTTIAVDFITHNAAYWIELRQTAPEQYRAVKRQLTEMLIDKLCDRLGADFASKIEVADLTTPATYHRYTLGNLGSAQGWLPSLTPTDRLPISAEYDGLDGFYYCGHWTEAGGGLPIAVKSARDVARRVCNKAGVRFDDTTVVSKINRKK